MKIGIDISQVIYGTGVSVYTKNIVSHLLEIDKKNDYLLFGGSLRRKNDLVQFTKSLSGNFQAKVLSISPSLGHLMWNQFHAVGIENFIGRVEVLHTSDWAEPPSKAFKVTTVHDLTPILYPEQTHPTIVKVHRLKLAHVRKESKRIIVPSYSTRDDLINYGMNEKNIRVIYEAPDPEFKKATKEEVTSTLRKFGVNGKYLLVIGTAPRKNIRRTIEAFRQLRGKCIDSLVIIGSSNNKPVKGVHFTNYVADEELLSLYTGAQALVYPSLYEGFGLPILEAFAAGIPVVTSNCGSMKEISGKSAVLVDPLDTSSIADGISTALKYSASYIKKGTAQVKNFSWKKAASETLQVYEESQ